MRRPPIALSTRCLVSGSPLRAVARAAGKFHNEKKAPDRGPGLFFVHYVLRSEAIVQTGANDVGAEIDVG
jgi:hypothetical protein